MFQLIVNKNTYTVSRDDNQYTLDDANVNVDISEQANGLISVLIENKSYTAIVEKIDKKKKEVTIIINGHNHTIAIKEPIDQLLNKMGLDLKSNQKVEPIKAPMPGMILKILVEVGQKIEKGDGLIILEAMKMENILKASVAATVKSIKITEKTVVEKGAILIEME